MVVRSFGDLGDIVVMGPSGVVARLRGRNVIKLAPGYSVKRVPRAAAVSGLGEDLFGVGRGSMMPGAEAATSESESADIFGVGRGSMMPGAEAAASESESADMFGVGEESDLF